MAKHCGGLGYEIVKAVINGEIIEPITFRKVKAFCNKSGIQASENHMRVILPNASENTIAAFERILDCIDQYREKQLRRQKAKAKELFDEMCDDAAQAD